MNNHILSKKKGIRNRLQKKTVGRPESLSHNRIRKRYRLIDHTADFGLHVFGADSKELFANAAHAMFDTLTETDLLLGTGSLNIQVTGDDWSDLMVSWLREVLFLWNGKELLVKKVQISKLSETELSADIDYDPFDPDRHEIKLEIKAVTYHQIQVSRGPQGWEAKIIFDI
jgi:SHS2 domain-containing protein